MFLLMSNQEVKVWESRRVGILLALVGGFLESYTYLLHGGVFANAQTGNMVLLTLNLASAKWGQAFYYFVPIVAFFIGVVVTQLLKLHDWWHEGVILFEIILLFLIGFYPLQAPSVIVNLVISFICSMQVSSFRKIRGAAYATTFCTGNLRSAAQELMNYFLFKDEGAKNNCLNYGLIIFSFCMGALIGGILIPFLKAYTVWICCLALIVVFVLLRKK